MSLNAAVWQIIFDAAEREEGVRAALNAALPVPADARERTWEKLQPVVSHNAGHSSLLAPCLAAGSSGQALEGAS